MTLPTNSKDRKATPIARGLLDYFPLACAAVARLSMKGNDKHNPGEPMRWAREKSTDQADCVARHLIERGTIEPESGELHEACLAWRALALLQLAEEKRLGMAAAAKPTNTTVVSEPVSFMWGEPPASVNNERPPVMEPGWLVEGNVATKLPLTQSPIPPTSRHVDGVGYTPQKKPFTFWYLATPYTIYPFGLQQAADMAARLAAVLILRGVDVFSPIAHSHSAAKWMTRGQATDHDLWMKVDHPFMEAASGLIVVTAPSWEKSRGIAEEIKRFYAAGKPVVYWTYGHAIPSAVMATAK